MARTKMTPRRCMNAVERLGAAYWRRAQQQTEAYYKKVFTFVDLTFDAPQSPMLDVIRFEDGCI